MLFSVVVFLQDWRDVLFSESSFLTRSEGMCYFQIVFLQDRRDEFFSPLLVLQSPVPPRQSDPTISRPVP